MKILRRLDHFLAGMEKAAVVFIFFLLVLMIIFNVLSRNFFQASFQGILELSPVLVLWLALAGSSLALRENRHIKIELFLRFVPERFRPFANVFTSIFGMVITCVLFFASLEFVANEISIFQWKGAVTLIFPWFFLMTFFRFFLKTLALKNRQT